MKPDIVETHSPHAAERDAILQRLIDFNDRRGGPTNLKQFTLILRDPKTAEIVGGLTSFSFYDWLYIDVLVIPEASRGQGLGTEMMTRVEKEARLQGCTGIWLNTFSFQARGFYEKLGFECFGHIDDHPRGMQRFFMRKRLVDTR